MIYDHQDLVIADIPGLIEGAHMGVGLGHSFLRHVQRTRILVHVIDGASEDPIADYSQINTELSLYDARLDDRPRIVVFNKMDLPGAQDNLPLMQAFLADDTTFEHGELIAVSAVARTNLDAVTKKLFEIASQLPEEAPEVEVMAHL